MLLWIAIAIMLLLTVWCGFQEAWLFLAPLIVGTVVIGILVWATIHAVRSNSNMDATRTEQWYTELVAMKTIDMMGGRFIFASGSFSSGEEYVYMYRTKTGAFKKGRQNSYHCTIRETDRVSPRRIYDRRFVSIPWLLPWELRLADSVVEFIVPPGSVTYKFEIN